MENLKDKCMEVHEKLDTLLSKVSDDLRNSIFGGYIRGFYGKKSQDIYKEIEAKAQIKLSSIKRLILSGDDNLLKYHIMIYERLFDYFADKDIAYNASRYQNSEYARDAYSTSKGFGEDLSEDFKKEFGNLPLTYLIRILKSPQKNNKIEDSPKNTFDEKVLYNPDDTTRDKLKKVNKKLSEELFDRGFGKSVPNILKQRYMFYGADKDQEIMKNQRLEGTNKNISQLFDIMDEVELLHHLNISIEMIRFLNKYRNEKISYSTAEEKMRAISFNESVVVCRTEGIHPTEYENKPIETKKRDKQKSKKVINNEDQINFFDKMN